MRLNKLLYSEIRLCVLRKWKIEEDPSYHLMDSYITDDTYLRFKTFYQKIHEAPALEKFDIIYEAIIEAIERPKLKGGEIIKLMRLFDHPQADRGVLRTILVTLKPLREKDPIAFMYQGLADVLRAGSTHNVI
ncbi:MAG: hypothetical protein EOO61_15405 [Hymenobacter sp.]|nr:MAG: hypothetical protein EOO61_15405 [Hymenobacter sp.]